MDLIYHVNPNNIKQGLPTHAHPQSYTILFFS